MKKLSYALPFLWALFIVVTLYQDNAERLYPSSMILPAIFCLGIAGLFLFLAWLNPRSHNGAPLVASIFTGAVLLWYAIPWWIFVIAIAVAVIYCINNKWNVGRVQASSILLSAILAVGILYSGVQAGITNAGKSGDSGAGAYTYQAGQPNIYFIVPDRFPSPEAMRESGIDPSQAVSDLRGLGFYVAEDKRSADTFTLDYPDKVYTTRTMRFFASVLNGGQDIPTEIAYQDCRTLIKDNQVMRDLHDQGYQVFNFASWFTETSGYVSADKNVKYGDVNIFERFIQNELGEACFNRTILRGLPIRTIFDNTDMEIRRHDWQAANILEIAGGGYTSTFVASHIMLPHEPYVYADSGLSTQDQYKANIEYALTYITDLAAGIRSLDPTAIIVIQSDEGMAYSSPPEINRELTAAQWSGVFTAWYLPGIEITENYKDVLPHTQILDIVVNR